jgi:hypothetical protein
LTRDVLVERSLEGDRNFAGFGKAAADEYSDCFIDPDLLPEDKLKVFCPLTVVRRPSLSCPFWQRWSIHTKDPDF